MYLNIFKYLWELGIQSLHSTHYMTRRERSWSWIHGSGIPQWPWPISEGLQTLSHCKHFSGPWQRVQGADLASRSECGGPSVRMSPSRNMQDFKDLLLNVWAPEDKGQRSPGVCTLKAQSSCGSESLHNIRGVVSMLWLISSLKRFHICVHAFVFFYILTIITANMKICTQDAFIRFL